MQRRCPQALFDKIIDGDEPQKFAARREVFDWIASQRPKIGDVLVIPHPNTGEEMAVCKTKSGLSERH